MTPNADIGRIITDHGFRWMGQSWSTCDDCGKPWNQHKGIEEPCREHGPFCTHKPTIKPWKVSSKDRSEP